MITRENTTRIIEMLYEGEIEPQSLVINLLNWLSEDEVGEFAMANDYFDTNEE